MLLNYEANKMKALLKSFYTLTNIRIVVFNDEFVKIAEPDGKNCDFCEIIRSAPTAAEKCLLSDKYACRKCKEQKKLYSYTCHAGLTETVTPIFHGSLVIGYLMFGQVLSELKKDAYWVEIERRCVEYDLNKTALKEAYRKMVPITLEKVYAAAQILEACAGYLWLQKYVALKEDDFLNRFDKYITDNLQANLSVTALCKHFTISRSKLYKVVAEYYGYGIEQLIKILRIKKAKDLLVHTDEPVSKISNLVGYADYNYFIKVFRMETGKTPYRYRKDYMKSSIAVDVDVGVYFPPST